MTSRSVPMLALALLTAVPGSGELAQGDRDKALSYLYSSEKMLLDAVGGLTPAHARFTPPSRHWNSLRYVQEIAALEEQTLGRVRNTMLQSAPHKAAPMDRAAAERKDQEKVLDRVERSQEEGLLDATAARLTSPSTLESTVARFRRVRSQTLDYIRNTRDDLRSHSAPHPKLGELDAYEWILLVAAETEHAADQIAGITHHPEFPGKPHGTAPQ